MEKLLLKNRTALITGGSRGIGKGICLAFARAGANIVFSYNRNVRAAEETVLEVKSLGVGAMAIQADAADEAHIKNMSESIKKEFGSVNILVNNAGTIGAEKYLVDLSSDEWDEVIAVDLKGVFLTCKYIIPLMPKTPVGKIINISSELSIKGRERFCHYAAAKGGINSLTRCLALELAPDILVNTIAPGPIETDMILADMEPEWIEKEKDIPLQRLGKVEEIAATALLLASDDGNFFCGQFISPNGGAVFI
jgi:3-oxoacyl-[acyl-carrier protein] reductase